MKASRAAAALSIAAAAGAVALALAELRLFEGVIGQAEYRTIDYRMRSAATPHADRMPIALLLFDSASVQGWPWLMPFPRAQLADLIDAATAAGAPVIGLDVFLDRTYPELNALDGGDERLRAAIERAGNVVLVAPTEGPPDARRLVPPDPYFADVAAAVATADVPTPFETVREVPLVARTLDGLAPSFALALYALARGIDLDALLSDAARTGRLDVPGLPPAYARVPATGSSAVPIRFAGPPSRPGREDGAFPAYGAGALQMLHAFGQAAVIEPWLRDRVVLLGSGFHDSEQFRTAFYDERRDDGETHGWTYGVEIHANALENLLAARFLRPTPLAGRALLVFAVALAVALACFRWGAKGGAVTALLALAAAWLGANELFARADLVVPIIAPTLSAFVALVGSTSYIAIVEGREKRMIRGAFGKYVSPQVVDELVADPSRLKLGGERRAITMLFSDLAGFTSLSESLEAERLVGLLNEYLDEMVEIVLADGGTLDKYMGDAIMALYGAPTQLDDHAVHACRTALRMHRRLDTLNEQWRQEGWPALHMRIGLNSGSPIVGNIGGAKRFDYTALGDAVNLAARLEPACKIYGVATMIGEQTRAAAGDAIIVRELDVLAVYGKAEPTRVYELIGMTGDDVAGMAEVIGHYENGLNAYRDRDFELAGRYFETALELRPDDGPARLYAGRCREYMLEPPPADWDFTERRLVK
jgi:class 3 adenylate cyclase/CHASE2 domain-containing sensor protein